VSARPWYRRFPDNFIAGTVGLSLEEKGAYSLILDLIYVRGGPLPDEPRYIAGVCGCSVRKWTAIRQRLVELGKIEVIDGFLTNHRAEIELENAAKVAREHAENGAKGGDKSAEIRAAANKNKGIGQAWLKHTRAPSTSTPFKKEGATALDPTERSVDVSRHLDPDLFARCVALTEPVPPFIDHKAFPVSVIVEAQRRTN
jgi:uncharacterized protein YdaU (DUF1376 family)